MAAVGKPEPNIWDVFQKRRSVRAFRPDSIPQKDIIQIIEAARMAPTSGNQQPWKFLIIRDKKVIIRMMEAKYTRVCITPPGIPVEWPVTPEKKELKEFIVFDKL